MLVIRLVVLFVFLGFVSKAQSIFDCKVSLSHSGTVESVLQKLENSCDVSFSYSSRNVPADSLVNVNFQSVDLRQALKAFLGNDVQIRTIGNAIILKVPQASNSAVPEKIIVRGVITDKRTNKVLQDVTIYSTNDLKPVLTDTSGYFEIEIEDLDSHTLMVYKEDYIDTLIIVSPEENVSFEISLRHRLRSSLDSLVANLEDLKFLKWLEKQDFQKHAKNLGDYLVTNDNYQLSLAPGLSTNGLMNSSSTVKLSFNLFAGYTGGINGIEVGGFVNLVKKDMKGVQAAGFANVVGGEISGVQVAGFTNISLNKMEGVQVAGFFNMAQGKTDGVQIAGFTNLSTHEQNGLQIAGFTNVCPKKVNATQISGFFNMGKKVNGLQIAGFSNLSIDDMNGTQISGFYNHVGNRANGGQIGIVNYAQKLNGFQIGIVNIVPDSITGIPIGLFSIAPKGYTRVQFEYSPTIKVKTSLISGVKSFYNVLSIGARDTNDFTIGYGLGGMIPIAKPVAFNIQAAADQFMGDFKNVQVNINSRLSAGLHLRLGKRFELYGSYNLNFHTYQSGDSFGTDIYSFTDGNQTNEAFQDWSVGVRI